MKHASKQGSYCEQRDSLWMKNEHRRTYWNAKTRKILFSIKYAHTKKMCLCALQHRMHIPFFSVVMNDWSNRSNSIRFACMLYTRIHTNFILPDHFFCCDSQQHTATYRCTMDDCGMQHVIAYYPSCSSTFAMQFSSCANSSSIPFR